MNIEHRERGIKEAHGILRAMGTDGSYGILRTVAARGSRGILRTGGSVGWGELRHFLKIWFSTQNRKRYPVSFQGEYRPMKPQYMWNLIKNLLLIVFLQINKNQHQFTPQKWGELSHMMG